MRSKHTVRRSRSERGFTLQRRFTVQRGFTLVELAIVVVIIGIMATLAVYGLSGYLRKSKTAEAVHMLGSIKAGQEAYFDETFRYLNVSGSMATLYPEGDWDVKVQWGGGNTAVRDNFRIIGVEPEAPVQFRYACTAGTPDDMPNDGAIGEDGVAYGLANAAGRPSHWYLAKAVADLNNNGVRSVFVASSFSSEIFSHNAGE